MEKIIELLEKHNAWRKQCINLIASENVMSPYCEQYYVSDLMHRYAEGLPFHRYYQGLEYVDQIEDIATQAFKDHFHANFVDLRPISGTLANLAIFSALAERGDTVMNLGIQGGSHVSHEQAGAVGVLGLKSYALPFDEVNLTLDLPKIEEKILELKPKFIVMGGSVITFPQPIRKIRAICDKTDTKIIYDAAHVFGLITAGKFQNPLEEGADIITASTHKTFPGPQGGIIIGNNLDEKLIKKIQNKVFPGVLSNHHLHRIPPLYLSLREMQEFGDAYADQIIKNAQALAKALDTVGFDVLYKDRGFTQSHQVVVNVEKQGGGDPIAKKLEETNIILNKNIIPGDTDNPNKPKGLRIGVQEMTRFGMKEKEMEEIARLISDVVIKNEETKKVKKKVEGLRERFQKTRYCFE
ncbi:MAG: serine hydroxymethyltransferase [Candidatus Paceibacterota bacterium]|jgi:glycine hydroxymethyltransferase